MSNQSSNQATNEELRVLQAVENDKKLRKHQQFNNYLTNFRYYDYTPILNTIIVICLIVIIVLIIVLYTAKKWGDDVLLTIFIVLCISTAGTITAKIIYLILRDTAAYGMIYLSYEGENAGIEKNIKTFNDLGKEYKLVLSPSEESYFSEKIATYYK